MPDYFIADDLSGALDAAAAFHRAGRRVRIALDPAAWAAAGDGELVALTTETRNAAPASAAATVAHVLAELADRKEPDAMRGRALLLDSRLAEARGAHDDAVHLAQRATQELEAALGGTHPELARALLLAGDLQLAGHAQEAETDYRQVVAIFETLGQADAAGLAHARAGIQLARWGAKLPADAAETLQWGLSPSGDPIDPAVAGWIAEQLGRHAERGDHGAVGAARRR